MTAGERHSNCIEGATREARLLDDRIADIRRREADGALTVREAAAERIAVMEKHLEAVRLLCELHLGSDG